MLKSPTYAGHAMINLSASRWTIGCHPQVFELYNIRPDQFAPTDRLNCRIKGTFLRTFIDSDILLVRGIRAQKPIGQPRPAIQGSLPTTSLPLVGKLLRTVPKLYAETYTCHQVFLVVTRSFPPYRANCTSPSG